MNEASPSETDLGDDTVDGVHAERRVMSIAVCRARPPASMASI
jgi:hypothetical protein